MSGSSKAGALLLPFLLVLNPQQLQAQGVILFANSDARVTYLDGTPVGGGFTAQLWGGPEGTPIEMLQPLFPTTVFGCGLPESCGYIRRADVQVPGLTSGPVVLVMRVFDGPSWDQSTCRGQSLAVTNSIIPPPGSPDTTTGLRPFQVNCLSDPPAPKPSVNLVQNGSFEDPSFAPWNIAGTEVFPNPPAIDGTNSMSVFGTVSQLIETVPGQNYRLQGALIFSQRPDPQATWGEQSLPLAVGNETSYNWQYRAFHVQADSTGMLLSFVGGFFLDDVSLEPLPERPMQAALGQWQLEDLGSPAFTVEKLLYSRSGFAAFGTEHLPGTNVIIVSTSENGTNWQQRFSQSAGPGQVIHGVTVGPDLGGGQLFVAVGNSVNVVSVDGVAWAWQESPPAADLQAVAAGQGIFAAVGADVESGGKGVVFTSSSGTNWVPVGLPIPLPPLHGICFAKGRFIAVGDLGTIISSADGRSWVQLPSGTSAVLRDVVFGGTMFVAVGKNVLLTSADGINWTAQTVPDLQQVTYHRGLLVAVGPGGNGQPNLISSLDAVSWTAALTPLACSTVAIGPMVLGAAQNSLLQFAPLSIAPILWPDSLRRRSDGRVWLMVDAEPGQNFVLEMSPNLRDWSPLQQVTAATSTFDLIDSTADNSATRFYRLRSPGP